MEYPPEVTILKGNALEILRTLPDESVHCIVTSPPYFGLRNYGEETISVWGGKLDCNHEWKENIVGKGERYSSKIEERRVSPKQLTNTGSLIDEVFSYKCEKCGAWKGQLGHEPTPELYVQHLLEIGHETKRVLRNDGTLWFNIGDTFWGSGGSVGHTSETKNLGRKTFDYGAYPSAETKQTKHDYLKPKDMCGIPWMVAIAFQKDGWWLRCDIIWSKMNPMPESVEDRPTRSHEYIFLLAKSRRYYYDLDAVRVAHPDATVERCKYTVGSFGDAQSNTGSRIEGVKGGNPGVKMELNPLGRNLFSVWHISTKACHDAHFAVFPPEIPELAIKAGTSKKGVCSKCGAPWERIKEKGELSKPREIREDTLNMIPGRTRLSSLNTKDMEAIPCETIGWRPTCKCYNVEIINNPPKKPSKLSEYKEETLAQYKEEMSQWGIDIEKWRVDWERLKPIYNTLETVPSVILDPFAGSGTTGIVARSLGQSSILIEINPKYVEMIKKRCDVAHKPLEFFFENDTNEKNIILEKPSDDPNEDEV